MNTHTHTHTHTQSPLKSITNSRDSCTTCQASTKLSCRSNHHFKVTTTQALFNGSDNPNRFSTIVKKKHNNSVKFLSLCDSHHTLCKGVHKQNMFLSTFPTLSMLQSKSSIYYMLKKFLTQGTCTD